MDRVQVVLVAGGSCSGKSEFAKWFHNALSLDLDRFYYPLDRIPKDKQGEYNFDTPEAIDLAACAKAVKELVVGKSVEVPTYSFIKNNPIGKESVQITKSIKFIIVEGMYTFFSPLLELGDIKIFLDTPTEIRIARRMTRDVERKNRTKHEILSNFIEAEKGYQKFVEPTKKYADLVIPFSFNPITF